MQETGASTYQGCPNCGEKLVGPYCSRCGEKKIARGDLSLAFMFRDLVEHFALLDNKIVRTLWALVSKPGLLTQRFIEGGRSRYTKPLTLFVILNLVFFVIQPHTGLFRYSYQQYTDTDGRRDLVTSKIASTGESEESYKARFNARLREQMKSLLIVSVPLFALVMLGLFASSGRSFTEHLVFASHVYAFNLFLLAFALGIGYRWLLKLMSTFDPLRPLVGAIDGELALTTIIIAAMTTYISLALRRAYKDGLWSSLVRGLVLAASMIILVYIYHNALFFATLWTT